MRRRRAGPKTNLVAPTRKQFDASNVTFIRPDVALVHVTNEMSGLVGPDAQAMPSHTELSLRVLVKEGAAWRIAAFQNTIVQR